MKKNYSRSEILFFCAYILWVTVFLLKYTYVKQFFPIKEIVFYAQGITIALLVIKFFEDKMYQIWNFIGLGVVAFCGIIEYRVQDNTVYLFMLFLFIYSAANIDFRDILKVTLAIQVAIFVVTIGMALTGVIDNITWSSGDRNRQDLGFIYCTFSSHILFFITTVYCSIRKKITLLEMLVLGGMNIALYFLNDTRLDLLIVCPYLFLLYIGSKFSIKITNNKWARILYLISGVLIAIINIALQKYFIPANSVFSKLNQLLSNRLYYGNKAINEYGFSLFGQHIRWVGQGGVTKNPSLVYNYVDSSFLKYTLNYGVVFLLILSVGLIWMGHKSIKDKNSALCLSIIFLCVFSAVDAELCVLAFHPYLLYMGDLLNPQLGGSYETTK